MKNSTFLATFISVGFILLSGAFVPSGPVKSSSTTSIYFGIPTFGAKQENQDDKKKISKKKFGKKKFGKKKEEEEKKKEIGLSGLVQLITAGVGSPFLGEFEGVDKTTGKMMFSLEANNLVDEEGKSKQTSMPYFESGWVDPEDVKKENEGFKFPWDKK
mmetsp:Transcript_32246/g.36679  ORF Transcript_32246/g.36679 Transcript_32246/m.36679 type:complete len:159 (-) Transcript_32246:277-753(-)